jgi:hypothetical protein
VSKKYRVVVRNYSSNGVKSLNQSGATVEVYRSGSTTLLFRCPEDIVFETGTKENTKIWHVFDVNDRRLTEVNALVPSMPGHPYYFSLVW